MRSTLLATSAALIALAARAQTAPPSASPASGTATAAAPSADPAPAADSAIVVTGRRLDLAREALLPNLGANSYSIGRAALDVQPQGDDRSLSNVLLQTPGVSQDNFGQIHIRNEHANNQYRLNGIIVPEPISGFGGSIDTRIADSISVITGALPAQYGYRTAGIIDIKTRGGRFDNTGSIGFYGGNYDTYEPSATVQVGKGGFNGFGSFSYEHTSLGIDNPIPSRATYNNNSDQYRGFLYASQILSDTTRLSAIAGVYDGRFGIPAVPGRPTMFTYNGQTRFDSSELMQSQKEENYYGTVALQYSRDALNFQIAPFFRLSRTRFFPDVTGDLLFNGRADQSRLASDLFGVQADGSYKLGTKHTVRFGGEYQSEITHSNANTLILPLDDGGAQIGDQPFPVASAMRKLGTLYGVYLQDEWTPASKLVVNFGARFDRVEAYTREQQLSPRINAVYTFSDKAAAHIGYARNFTPPPQELIETSQTTLGTFTATALNPGVGQVKAEREHLFDAGLNLTPLPHFTLTFDGYYKIKRNLLDDGQFGEAYVQAPFNYARGYNYGIEVGGAYRKGPLNLYANVAAAEQRANQIVSSQFFFAPDELAYIASHYIYTDHSQKLTGSAGASYAIDDPLGRATIAADLIYGSGLRNNPSDGSLHPNGSKLPAYEQVNLGVSQKFEHGTLRGVELKFDVVNLFDAVYEIRDGSGVGIGAAQYGPRRAFYTGVAKRF